MEGLVEEEASPSAGKVIDQLFPMPQLVPVLFIVLLMFILGINWLIAILLICYVSWVQKQYFESERRRILFEERKRSNTKRVMSEGETLRWVNESLKVMWPVCMQKFASQNFFTPMAPWFLDRYKPKYVTKVTMNSLHLGNTPPFFRLIHVLQSSQDKEEVVFEAQMEFLSDEVMGARLIVEISGVKITFYISKLYIKGTVKFSLNFVGGWPVLGRIQFCFANAPTVNMDARGYGLYMGYIPGAKSWLEETLGRALEESVVEPYMLVIDMEKLVSNMMFSEPKPSQGLQDFFSVEHRSDFTVLVEILEAGDLKAGRANGLPDPIVELSLRSHIQKTKSRPKTINPVWTDEKHRFPIENWEYSNILILRVIHKSWRGQVELGICSTPVKEFQGGERKERKLPLERDKETVGWIKFAVTVEHRGGSESHEEPRTTFEFQTQTQDIASITPPDSAATTRSQALGVKANPLTHTGNSSTEVETGSLAHVTSEPSEPDGGSTEIIKIHNIPDGAVSIQFPEKEKSLYFSLDPPRTRTRKPKSKSKGAPSSNEPHAMSDSKVKQSMKRLLRKARNISKVSSHDKSPPDREMIQGEHSGYSSSLDCSSELKVYHGSLKVNLQLSPDMASLEPRETELPCEPLNLDSSTKLETVHSVQDPDNFLLKTPDLAHTRRNNFHEKINEGCTGAPQSEIKGPQLSLVGGAVGKSSISNELNEATLSSTPILQSHMPEKQNSKNRTWLTKFNLPKRRKNPRKSKGGKVDYVSAYSFERDPGSLPLSETDTSATQSFREEGSKKDFKTLSRQGQPIATDGSPENHRSILASSGGASGSQSCRVEPSNAKKITGTQSMSMRFDSLNTIHERHDRLDRTA
ncbi:uncharacterized protein [Physcomitrium patens]|uniref:C2 domain-containing protein n=1 Tax=Physcomitrium patens TaxID=3218 RepID=A0A2K1KA88_PHYPA|nr:C2 domain-containing protein At1g53590-like isoform X2 [Physcomitrium patens]PNR50695.1 hypothetical protein PHYPA_009881 [Physcomitrium patens]|eukprot:XP_024380727.1 C2 domain-containing protein At1g53590-like isoform X2 [Physcomitrella patens]